MNEPASPRKNTVDSPKEQEAPKETLPSRLPSRRQEGKMDSHSDMTPKEIGGPQGLEPTRYGDWERNGRCYDF